MKILGISGRRGVGKTCLARRLKLVHKYELVSFADPLRKLAATLFPFDETDFTDTKKKESKFRQYDWTPRGFMINLGEFMRYHDPSYWLNIGLAQCIDPKKVYVFDDVRFINEADAIKNLGGKIVRLTRYEKENPYGKNLDIESEKQLDNYKFDHIIHEFNNRTIRMLNQQADQLAEMF